MECSLAKVLVEIVHIVSGRSQQSLANATWIFANVGIVDSVLLNVADLFAIDICGGFVVQGASNLV